MATILVERVQRLKTGDLSDLCAATIEAIQDGIGFGWVRPPAVQRLENFWRGVTVVPERELFVGRVDGAVAGAVQLVKPVPSFEAGMFSAAIETHFVAPWARGHGLARQLLEAAEDRARELNFSAMRLDVRATQQRAIQLYESIGYLRWGTLDKYHLVQGQMIAGYFYVKDLGATRAPALPLP
jgi:ribosomal protein S18 acetylase RimI-like enzyme